MPSRGGDPRMKPPAHLVIGIDGGATHTAAVLADAATGAVLGRGEAGPSNIMAAGADPAPRELNAAGAKAFAGARLPRAEGAAACVGLAGVDLAGRDVILGWAELVGLARKVEVAN